MYHCRKLSTTILTPLISAHSLAPLSCPSKPQHREFQPPKSSLGPWPPPIHLTVRCKSLFPRLRDLHLTILTTSDLLRRLDPKHTSQHLQSLIQLVPSLTEDLLSSVDQPLTIRRCRKTGRDYLICDYNRDGDSYRSPWSGEFEPPLEQPGDGGVGENGNEGAGE